MPTRCARGALIAAALILLPTVILSGAWRLGGVSALEDDLLYYLPMRQYVGERIAAGEWPLWNPLVGMGTSLAADPQSGLWYPPTWLFAIAPALIAYPLTVILHFALAGWGMYRFLRASRRDWASAFMGAIAFEFCGFLIAHRVHLTMHEAVAWVPWMLYAWRRLADNGRFKYLALGAGIFGLQMLVQHTQISIMTAIVVTAYVAVVLFPDRRSLLWQYSIGMAAGAAIGAVQTIPTLMQLSVSGRGVPAFATFVENSWVPSSALMLLFPMFFGNRTPAFWGTEWWGLSHFCEQFAYGSIIVLVLAVSSHTFLAASPPRRVAASGACSRLQLRRETAFWWGVSIIALVLALGEFTPISRVLFHVPVYRNLRVPARWVLVWSLAMPILASAVVAAIRQGGPAGERASRAIRRVGTRVLPVAVLLAVILVGVARWRVGDLEAAFGHRWGVPTVLAGLRSAIRPGNPAIIWPIVLMVLSVALLLRWAKRPTRAAFVLICGLMVVDLAGVAAFVDVDTRTYRRRDLLASPPLARAIKDLHPDPGHRLLVPRYQADYQRPLEVLWPQTNMREGIPTFNAYGPLWTRVGRLLLRFMPWGSSEAMLELLRNPDLCATMGVRFLAARTAEEHAIVAAARSPALPGSLEELADTNDWRAVQAGDDVLWPVRLDQPGIYELRLEAAPGTDPASQWFIRLETLDARQIGFPRRLEPADLSEGERPFSFLFVCPDAMGAARARIKSESGHALSVRRGVFGRVAGLAQDSAGASGENARRFRLVGMTSDQISLFEIPGAVPLVRIAPSALPVLDVKSAIASLLAEEASIGLPQGAVFEWHRNKWGSPPSLTGGGSARWGRPSGQEVFVTTDCASNCLVVFNESFAPGWSAEVNGEPARLLRVNAVVQGVIAPAGTARVTFRYQPPGLLAGMLISGASLIGILTGLVAIRGRYTPQPRGSSEV